jgi:hypothetical protein
VCQGHAWRGGPLRGERSVGQGRGRHTEAFDTFSRGLAREYPSDRFKGAKEVLAEDLGLAAAAWTRAEPKQARDIQRKLQQAGGRVESGPSLRFLLTWETDATDVDLHIRDARGGHAFYRLPTLPSGGRLYADVKSGYAPECFTVRGPAARRASPYWLEAHHDSRGPLGHGPPRPGPR